MQAVVLTGHGGPEKLVYTQVDKPCPQAGEVLIQVEACSMNNTDLNARTGWYTAKQEFEAILQDKASTSIQNSTAWGGVSIEFPRIQWADIIGKVLEVGAGIDQNLLQQRVMVDPWIRDKSSASDRYVGSELDGGFAEYAVIPASNVYPIHSPLSDIELACFPCSYSTAENMLVKGRVTGSDTVLIMGASGGVGSALIQLCKLRGATAIAIASPSKQAFVRELGADFVYNRDEKIIKSLADHAITVYLDTVDGEHFPQLLKRLQVGGMYVTCGAIGGPIVQLDLRELIYKDLEMIGATRMEATVFQSLVNYINQNLLKPVVANTFPLSQIKAAQQAFQSKNFCGKIVITLDEA
ncbi:MAG: alcohol dehydrogenase family protein [Hormoscilla sp. SP5CHS1]|nr:alcohol dehydrogenase family protein [Hormoscilla sp. SP5CHS1]